MLLLSLNTNIFLLKLELSKFCKETKQGSHTMEQLSCFSLHLVENKEAVLRGVWKVLSTLPSALQY